MKNYTKTKIDRAWFKSPFTTSGLEMEQVYSYNTGALMGHIHIQDLDYEIDHSQKLITSLSHGPATKKMTSKS